jgi:hypothetical protein
MTSILRGVDSFDTADAVTTDDTGLVGNYEVILAEGNYTSGTYSYPNGHTEADYSKIVLTGINSSNATQIRASSEMSADMIALPWSNLRATSATDSQNIAGQMTRTSTTDFTVLVDGIGAVAQIYGYLKEGVI